MLFYATVLTAANIGRGPDLMLRSLPPKAKEKGKDCPCVWKIQKAQPVSAGLHRLHACTRVALPRLWHALPAVQLCNLL